MNEPQPAGGNVVVYARVRDADARLRLRQLLDNLPGERVNSAVYEVDATDWDDGLWDEEVERMRDIIDPDTDTLLYWQVVDGRLVRTCIAGRYA
jgi:hypothetical protein